MQRTPDSRESRITLGLKPMTDTRRRILADLIELRTPVSQAIEAAAALPWDQTYDLVVFPTDHARAALRRYLSDEVTTGDLEEWAEVIHGRDDIAIEQDDRTHRLVPGRGLDARAVR